MATEYDTFLGDLPTMTDAGQVISKEPDATLMTDIDDTAAGHTVEIVVYPGTPHAFFADYRPSCRAEPAADGWKRMLAWFKSNGVA